MIWWHHANCIMIHIQLVKCCCWLHQMKIKNHGSIAFRSAFRNPAIKQTRWTTTTPVSMATKYQRGKHNSRWKEWDTNRKPCARFSYTHLVNKIPKLATLSLGVSLHLSGNVTKDENVTEKVNFFAFKLNNAQFGIYLTTHIHTCKRKKNNNNSIIKCFVLKSAHDSHAAIQYFSLKF